jgi:hypothetical protein
LRLETCMDRFWAIDTTTCGHPFQPAYYRLWCERVDSYSCNSLLAGDSLGLTEEESWASAITETLQMSTPKRAQACRVGRGARPTWSSSQTSESEARG